MTESLEDEAYPVLDDGIEQFIQRYLDAPESVLVLQGPPGTGKTKLIRTILGSISRHKGENARVIYTGDEAVLRKDEVFIKFLSGGYDTFLIEDADLLLKPRTDGNNLMHRFLNVADGIATSNRRKIIFSTNLANVRDIDSALVRPGRCFAHVALRKLSATESTRLANKLCGADGDRLAAVLDNLAIRGGVVPFGRGYLRCLPKGARGSVRVKSDLPEGPTCPTTPNVTPWPGSGNCSSTCHRVARGARPPT